MCSKAMSWLSGPVPQNQEVIFRFVYKIFVYTKLIKSTRLRSELALVILGYDHTNTKNQ